MKKRRLKNEKFSSVSFNNRKKQITCVYTSGKEVTIHFGQLGFRKNLDAAWVDEESGRHSIGFRLSDGTEEFMPYDQPLYLVKDPEFMLQYDIELLLVKIKEELKKQRISKRYLASHLRTSDNQVHRLLNPNILNKNLGQLYQIASVLGLEFELRLKKSAA